MRKVVESRRLRSVLSATMMVGLAGLILAFQNCAPANFSQAPIEMSSKADDINTSFEDETDDSAPPKSCVDLTKTKVIIQSGLKTVECPSKRGESCAVICHRPPGNPANQKTLLVGVAAIDAHLNHSTDELGPCDDGEPTQTACEEPDDSDDDSDDQTPNPKKEKECGKGGGVSQDPETLTSQSRSRR